MDFRSLLTKLSDDGQNMITENGFTNEDVMEFTEEDILEFPGKRDRFLLRKFSRIHNVTYMPASSPYMYDHDSPKDSMQDPADALNSSMEESADLTDHPDPSASCSTSTITTELPAYSADELLETKPRKKKGSSKTTAAQNFFSALLKDSAKSAHIWKRAPCLSQISTKSRDHFMQSMIRGAPVLDNPRCRTDVWRQLGQSLENRRKYLRDLSSGKRILKKPKHSINVPKENSNTITSLSSEQTHMCTLLSRNKSEVIGKGLAVSQLDSLFSEVVLTELKDNVDDHDLEMPVPHGMETSLSKNLLKKKIVWKTDRLSKSIESKTTEKRSLQKENSHVHGGNACKKMKKSEIGKSAVTTEVQKKSEKNSVPNKVQKKSGVTRVQKKSDVATKVQKNKEEKSLGKERQKGCGEKRDVQKTCATKGGHEFKDDDEMLSVFEWEDGKLYIGLHVLKDPPSESYVVSCQKPVAKIKDDQELELWLPKSLASPMCKLNKKDVQKNPNPKYRVMSSAFYKLDAMSTAFIIPDEEEFFDRLLGAFNDYM